MTPAASAAGANTNIARKARRFMMPTSSAFFTGERRPSGGHDMIRVMRRIAFPLVLSLAFVLAGCASVPADTPRIAVISAFPAELALLESKGVAPQKRSINGVAFTTGTLQGKPVVLFLSGISM